MPLIISNGKLLMVGGKLAISTNCCCGSGLICDECCDCAPATLTAVVTGTSTAADGTWTLTNSGMPSLCKWTFANAGSNVNIVAIKSGENMDLVIKNFAESTTFFDGDQTTDHKGACKRLDYTITNGAGTGSADVDGTCTPSCATGCDETFDPPVDSVPCTGCCASCVPEEVRVTLSGITICTSCMAVQFNCYKPTSISLSAATLTRNPGANPCTWGGTSPGTSVGTLGYDWGVPMIPGSCSSGDCATSTSAGIYALFIAGVLTVRSLGGAGDGVLFHGTVDNGCSGTATNEATDSSYCGTAASPGGTWIAYGGTATVVCP